MNPQLKTLEQLQHTFDSGLTRPLSWRQQQLKQLARFLEDHEKDLLDALQQDLGKCPSESQLTEIQFLSVWLQRPWDI